MPFKVPLNSPLTEVQAKAVSKVNSLRTYTSVPDNLFPNLSEEQQISTFDFSLKLLNSVSGNGEGDKVFNKFMNKIFAVAGPDSIVLEEMIIKALADSLEARDIYLAPEGVPSTSGETITSGATVFSGQTGTTENADDFRQVDVIEYKFFAEETPITSSSEEIQDNIVKYSYSIDIDESADENNITITIIPSSTLGNSEVDKLDSIQKSYTDTTGNEISESNRIVEELKEQAKNTGFSENGQQYPKEGEALSSQAVEVQNNLVITIKNNYESAFPEFQITYSPLEVGERTTEEIIDELQDEANRFGFVNNGIEYPKTSTEIAGIEPPFGNITGQVFEKGKNETIPGAIVEILGAEPRLVVKTDFDGKYSINNVKGGKYDISASYFGEAYEDSLKPLFTVVGGKDNLLNFELEEKIIFEATGSTGSTSSTEGVETNPEEQEKTNEDVDNLMSGGTVSASTVFTYSYNSDIVDGPLGLEIETYVFPLVNGEESDDYPPFTRYTTLEGPLGYRTIPQFESQLQEEAQQKGFTPDNGIVYPKTDTVAYTYTVVGEPLEYFFTREIGGNTLVPKVINTEEQADIYFNAIESNENDESLTVNLKVENNNPNLPTFEKLFTINPDDAVYYLSDIESEVDSFEENLVSNGANIIIDENTGLTKQYPASAKSVIFKVDNNIDLPSFTASTTSDSATVAEAYNSLRFSHSVGFEKNGIQYPAEGSTITQQTIVDENGNEVQIPVIGEPTNEESDSLDNIPVGSLDVPSGFQFSAITSSIVADLQNSLDAIVDLSFNPADIGLTNIQYLNKYLLPELIIGKRELVRQITTMLFGPKELMSEDPEIQDKLLNSAACGEAMFSVTNNPSQTDKDLEFNRIELKEQLKKGKIELIISCQKVEISLPENFIEEFDLESAEVLGVSEADRPNPATSFTLLSNFIQNEVQAQRNAQDGNQVKRSFFQILIEKILQYVSVAFSVSPEIETVFNIINVELSKTGQDAITNPSEFLSSPCDINNACKSGDEEEFKKKSAFSQSLIDSLYALVLSMILERLLAELKIKIKRIIQQKAQEKILKLRKRLLERFKALEFVEGAASSASKAVAFQNAFNSSGIQDIFNLANQNRTN